ncbi:MAG: helix-turn-helix transcriptional regulator [Candidatus Magasanikbacteria bacterium]|jgi:putative transcriptional regulator|nr:helix-turn-helix transcriptional regulator [Candidatus Magasanikbacteria bacterium]
MKKLLQNTVYTLRSKKNMTQQELADALGVTRQTIIAIEKGNYTPSVTLALDIALFFSTSIEAIFYYES